MPNRTYSRQQSTFSFITTCSFASNGVGFPRALLTDLITATISGTRTVVHTDMRTLLPYKFRARDTLYNTLPS